MKDYIEPKMQVTFFCDTDCIRTSGENNNVQWNSNWTDWFNTQGGDGND